MQFTYGGGQFDEGSVFVKSFNQQMVPAQNGRPFMLHKTLHVEGKVVDQGGNAMSKLNGIYGTLSSNGHDAGFAGTPIFLTTGNAMGNPGVIVSRPCSHSEVKGAEGVTYIRWEAGFEAFYPLVNGGEILAFTESITFTSNHGAPIYVERLPVYGLPILQQTSSSSWYFCTQQGSRTTAFSSYEPLPMIFPENLRTSGNNGSQVTLKSPEMLRGHYLGWTTTWKYEYISALPFFATPSAEY